MKNISQSFPNVTDMSFSAHFVTNRKFLNFLDLCSLPLRSLTLKLVTIAELKSIACLTSLEYLRLNCGRILGIVPSARVSLRDHYGHVARHPRLREFSLSEEDTLAKPSDLQEWVSHVLTSMCSELAQSKRMLQRFTYTFRPRIWQCQFKPRGKKREKIDPRKRQTKSVPDKRQQWHLAYTQLVQWLESLPKNDYSFPGVVTEFVLTIFGERRYIIYDNDHLVSACPQQKEEEEDAVVSSSPRSWRYLGKSDITFYGRPP